MGLLRFSRSSPSDTLNPHERPFTRVQPRSNRVPPCDVLFGAPAVAARTWSVRHVRSPLTSWAAVPRVDLFAHALEQQSRTVTAGSSRDARDPPDCLAGPSRGKAALNAFDITFDGRLSAGRK